MTKKLREFFYFFLIKRCNLLIPRTIFPGLYKGSSKLQKKLALKREHPALQKMEFITFFQFCVSFLPFWIRIWIRIRNLDPDPGTPLNPAGSATLIPKLTDHGGKTSKLQKLEA